MKILLGFRVLLSSLISNTLRNLPRISDVFGFIFCTTKGIKCQGILSLIACRFLKEYLLMRKTTRQWWI
jgi:hypothetical protein